MNRLVGYSGSNPGLAFSQGRAMGAQNKLLRQQQQFGQEDRERALSERQSQKELSAIGMLGGIVERAAPEMRQDAYAQGLSLLSEQGLDVSSFPQQYDQNVANKLAIGRQLAFDSGLLKQGASTARQQNLMFEAKAMADSGKINSKTGKPYTVQEALGDLVAVGGGIDARAGMSAQERMGRDPYLSSQVAQSQAQIAAAKAGASEAAKSSVEMRWKPEIERAVATAKEQAKSFSETESSLNQRKAALPGLLEVTGQLKNLAGIATNTVGGKVFDVASKELGFGATQGATARAKYIAIIDNQVLPLLKPTFGAAFTEREGDRLKATLGDPDASTAEKVAQLEAFEAALRREIETKQREISSPAAPSQSTQQVSAPSDADLLKKYGIE